MPPPLRRDGGFIAPGFSAELDEARSLREDSRKVMAALEARYLQATGIKSLKVRHNNILGFYIEVPGRRRQAPAQRAAGATFRHRQTMAGAVRFTTEELVETESRIVASARTSVGARAGDFCPTECGHRSRGHGLGRAGGGAGRSSIARPGLPQIAAEQGYTSSRPR